MSTILILSHDEGGRHPLAPPLTGAGFATTSLPDPSRLPALTIEEFPDLVLLDLPSLSPNEAAEALKFCHEMHIPTLALLRDIRLLNHSSDLLPDDFILAPPNPEELAARAHQVLRRFKGRDGPQTIRVGDLAIDLVRYEVTVAGRKVILTFKEYELLRLLASAPGRVFTRDELLSRVWRYDYFGGTRTVDVHIRRLRSKVEDAHHTFIETVWNVGYRFKEPVAAG
jgi:two-component system alkaline phosphatase synthesis response regulator PhoP